MSCGMTSNPQGMSGIPDDLTEDAFLDGALHLRQPRRGHRAGHDAILLAAATPARPNDRAVEFGAGVGAAGFALARRIPEIDLMLVEIDGALADLARGNAALNAISAQVIKLDVTASAEAFAGAGLPPDSADVVLMNPPFNSASRHKSSPDAGRAAAHIDSGETLEKWIHAARRILKPKGTLTLIWRAEELGDVLAALDKGFGGIGIVPVHPDPASAAIRVLVRATKGSLAPMDLFPGLVLNSEAGQPTSQARMILAGQASLMASGAGAAG
ncbi:MAG: methyltransferase [Xanthobacteraceae bacterium]|nr:methyltransferase [Xanthobacteraceae bacterium]